MKFSTAWRGGVVYRGGEACGSKEEGRLVVYALSVEIAGEVDLVQQPFVQPYRYTH